MMRQTIERYADGDLVFRQGDTGDRMFVVLKGAVRIFRVEDEKETLLMDLGFGEIFGELSLFDQHPRSAGARAIGDTELRVITQEEYMSLDCDMIIRKMMVSMAERLRALDGAFQRLQNYGTTDEELVRLLKSRDVMD